MTPHTPMLNLPPQAAPALDVLRRLVAAGHVALLAGGCVRDLLRGEAPADYDVATDAVPQRVAALFRPTRQVGAQFGVMLVKSGGRWVEVATFRSDGEYRDGRRPESVAFTTPREDALRRDFTINGMFFNPLTGEVLDFVGGQADLRAGVIRAIGDPAARFSEDHLRLLRAIRFAARLAFAIEPLTAAAIRADAARLTRVAAERVREELEKMLGAPSRASAVAALRDHGLLAHLWRDPPLRDDAVSRALVLLARLSPGASFELAFAVLTASLELRQIEEVCRQLTCSNDQREAITWLARNQAALDDPTTPTLAALKRLMTHPHFPSLVALAEARFADLPDSADRRTQLNARCAAIAPDSIAPPPLITGDDLLARGIQPGPIYAEVLTELYTQQLDDRLPSRDAALAALQRLLATRV